VYTHISAVQEANRKYEQGVMPKMLINKFEDNHFGSIIDEIFRLNDKDKSLALIKQHASLWTQMQSGSQGLSGKKTINAITMFNQLFEEVNTVESEAVLDDEDSDEAMNEALGE
jgi:hypothetical protein